VPGLRRWCATTPTGALFYGWAGGDFSSRLRDRQAYFSSGVDYNKLCGNSGLYLDSFLQVLEVEGFGFELGCGTPTIRSYKNLTSAEQPTNDDQKMQRWVLQLSRVAGYNFGPYYKA
jgi:hypothetical protein